MLNYNVLIQYSLTVFIAIICLLPILLHKKSVAKNKVYIAIVLFVSNILLISLLLCALFLREVLSSVYIVNGFFRLIDCFLYGSLLFTWENLLEKLSLEASSGISKSYFYTGKIVSAVGTAVFILAAVLIMNDNDVSGTFADTVFIVSEVAFAAIATLVVTVSSIYACSIIPVRTTRRYISLISFFVSAYFIFQIWIIYGLRRADISVWNEPHPDFSGWLLFGMICLTLGFLFKKDFQLAFVPAYDLEEMEQNKPAPDDPEFEKKLRIDKIAADHRLTIREREILELLYKGHTNADISSKLSISPNTAKSHVRSIYDKLNVSSRMELSYLIDSFDFPEAEGKGEE